MTQNQYVASTRDTTPFHKAEKPVKDALALIEDRRAWVCGNFSEGYFNEILSAGYMENQKMNVRFFSFTASDKSDHLQFHSDDEVGLGAVVASLSLGSPCVFEFRKLHRETRETTCLKFVLHHVSEVIVSFLITEELRGGRVGHGGIVQWLDGDSIYNDFLSGSRDSRELSSESSACHFPV